MSKIYFFTILFFGYFAFAEDCNKEMPKFNISETKVTQICTAFSDSENFKTFRSCVFSTVKKFDKSASDKDVYLIPESDLNGVFSLCSGGKVRALPAARKITPPAPK